jgi:transcription antitermination factor NusG
MWDFNGGSSGKLVETPQSFVPGEQLPWYAIRVKARHEKSTASILRDKGYIEFLPLCASTRRWSDRIQQVELPLFPGYLFCRFEFNDRLPILKTPGVVHIVGMGNRPHAVDETEIAALQTVVKSGLLLQPWPFLKVGQRVIIQDGPLRDVEGILADIRDNEHLIVSITLLHRSVAVRVERSWVRPVAA